MKAYVCIAILLMASLCWSPVNAQLPQINELMTSNVSVLSDEDGEYPDWLEIYNPADSTIQMAGFSLSDDSLVLDKWTFPDIYIGPGGYLLVYCSGKNRVPGEEYYETIIRRGDEWKYRMGDSEPPVDWMEIGFDDTAWQSGPSGFGYGDGDDNTLIDETLSLYVRKTFSVEDTSKITSVIMNIDFDDSFVAYLNGKEITRSHIGEPGIPPAYDETGYEHEARMYRGLDPEQFEIDKTDLIIGNNLLAIQVHNGSPGSSDLTLIPFLTLVLSQSPDEPVGAPPELNFPGSYLHTSFKLRADGEMLILTDTSGGFLDSVSFTGIHEDVSYGRKAGEPDTWLYYEEPTPGTANSTTGIENIVDADVSFFPSAGFFNGSRSVSLSHTQQDGIIRYTTDGSVPDENATEYTAIINLSASTVIRARIFRDGHIPGGTVTNTYINLEDIDADNIPVLSISTDPDNLYDERDGLFLNAEDRELEKPVHAEFIEPDGKVGFSIDAGLKIFGNEPSGGYHQHKLAIFARSKYGYGEIDYQIFRDKPIEEFEAIILRNAINEAHDVLASRLIDDEAVAKQSYRPVIVFINGEYWGGKYMREKINEHFVASNFGVDPDSLDVIMGIESPVEYYNEEWPIAGDLEDYKDLIHYLIDHNLEDSANYEYIKTRIDIHNFITYQASEIYYGNIDWPGNNTKWWRERNPEGIYRWILFDVDAGLGAWEGPSYNSVLHATEPDGPEQWPNPPWSTFIFRKLLENQTFRDDFVLRSMDLLNTDFMAKRVNAELDKLIAEVDGEIRNHCRRWDGSYREWENEMENIRYFANRRVAYVKVDIRDYFGMGAHRKIDLNVEPPGGGRIRINSRLIESFPWDGTYFEDLPLSLEAIPAYGFSFNGWQGIEDTTLKASVQLDQSYDITAAFDPEEWYEPIVINEINYNASAGADTEDWIELYNYGTEMVDLSNWVLKDADDSHAFIFPLNTALLAGEYLVVCRTMNMFSAVFPEVQNVIGGLGFGLSGMGEIVRLFNDDSLLIDWVEYDDFSPWPKEPDGNGPTLSLSQPDLDNSVARNWFASSGYGTPGQENTIATHVVDPEENVGLYITEPWPNPFREQTTIMYSLPESNHLHISVYDIQGRLVDVLVNETVQSGENSVTWKAAGRRPGIYFCVIRTRQYSITKKLILIE